MAKKPQSAAKFSSWNGDERREAEAQGFDASRKSKGLKVIHGTRRPDENPADQLKKDIVFKPAPTSLNVARIGPNNGLG